jgi:hypothetical protein
MAFLLGWALIAGGGAALAGSVISSDAAKKAGQQQAAAAAQAQGQVKDYTNQAVDLNKPAVDLGNQFASEYGRLMGVSGDPNSAGYGSLGGPIDQNYIKSDISGSGFDFTKQQILGQTAAQNAMQGYMPFSGNAVLAGQQQAGNIADTFYGNAFNRYLANKNQIGNLFGQGMTYGQNARQLTTNALTGAGQSIAGLTVGAGNAQAAATVGSANAISNGLGQIGNMAAQYPMYNAMMNYMSPGGVRQAGTQSSTYTAGGAAGNFRGYGGPSAGSATYPALGFGG